MSNKPKTFKQILWIGLLGTAWAVRGQSLQFEELMIKDGLASVNALLMDHFGYQWFGGTHGLYQYDGYAWNAFLHHPDQPYTLSANDVTALFEDTRQNIWIGTSMGLNLWDRKREVILRFSVTPTLAQSAIADFEEDEAGNVWVGTLKNGIFVFSPQHTLKKHWEYSALNSSGLSNGDVFDILKDSRHRFWVVTNSGALDLFQPEDSSFVHYRFVDRRLSGVRTGQKLLEVDSNRLWVGTEGQGIFELDIRSKQFKRYHHEQPQSLSSDIITGMAKDSKNNVWISTDGGGLNVSRPDASGFAHYTYREDEEFGLTNNVSYSLLVDKQDRIWLGMGNGTVNRSINHPFRFLRAGEAMSFNIVVDLLIDQSDQLWVATGGKGIDIMDLKSKKKLRSLHTKAQPPLKTDIILCLYQDTKHYIWAGTFLGGVYRLDGQGNILQHFTHQAHKNSLANNHVFDLTEDQQGNLWIATQGGGIDRLNPTTQRFQHFSTKNYSGLISDRIQTLWVDEENRIWAGHFKGGVQLFDEISQQFTTPKLPDQLNRRLRHYPIHDLQTDTKGRLLIATGGMGLVVVAADFRRFMVYGQADGLPSDAVYGVIALPDHTYWVSTVAGIAQIDPKHRTLKTLSKSDGLLTNDFESGAIAAAQGEIYFASKEGIVYFKPQHISENLAHDDTDLVFTQLEVFNQPIRPGDTLGGRVVVTQSLLYSDHIQLPHAQNNFSLAFACPKFQKPDKLLFRYRLEGLDNRWIQMRPTRRFVNYSNIGVGDYTLRAQASADGGKIWGKEKALHLTVHPPFYRTDMAYLIYSLLLIGFAYVVFVFFRGRIRLRHQLKLEQFSREKDNELNAEKLSFFTEISHEIRTPLTLISGHLEQISKLPALEKKHRRQLSIMRKNVHRLVTLINQLLNFRKMESGRMRLKVAQEDISHMVEEIWLPFRELAIRKHITLRLNHHLKTPYGYLDASQLEIILYNLLSNALKFTPEGGDIELSLARDQGRLYMNVSDSGPGIAKENLEKIFDPFFQGRAGSQMGVTGTGLGLSLVKNAVTLHHGTLSVESEEGKKTVFKVSLAVQKADYQAEEVVPSSAEAIAFSPPSAAESSPSKERGEAHKFQLLLVEDHLDILQFLKDNLQDQYNIITAVHGKEGLAQVHEHMPDLVVSDMMMPEMDGIDLCRKIKKDPGLSHIPIIILTARTGFIHQHTGLDTGADDYITKPFHFDLLNLRIRNLLENRKLLHQKFRKEQILEPKDLAIGDPNEEFIAQLMHLIQENISDAGYTVERLAEDIGMSYSVLYRKVLALTHRTLKDLMKSTRLKKARQLLASGAHNVSEVGYMTGFTTPKYFSTCFKDEFGQSPSKFLRSNAKAPPRPSISGGGNGVAT